MKIGFLEEAEGVKSASRLIFVIGSIWNMLLCTYLILKDVDSTAMLAVFGTLQGVFTAIKLGQKAMEKRDVA